MTVWYLSSFWILSFCWSIFLIFFISFIFLSICFKITFWGSVNFPTLPCSVIFAVFKAVLASNILSKISIVIWIFVLLTFFNYSNISSNKVSNLLALACLNREVLVFEIPKVNREDFLIKHPPFRCCQGKRLPDLFRIKVKSQNGIFGNSKKKWNQFPICRFLQKGCPKKKLGQLSFNKLWRA